MDNDIRAAERHMRDRAELLALRARDALRPTTFACGREALEKLADAIRELPLTGDDE